MAKIIYKIVLFILIFFGALVFFVSQMNTNVSYTGKSEPMGENTFPCIVLEVQGETINALFAYSAPVKAQIVRESMTVLNDDKSIKIKLGDGKDRLTALKYQVLDKESSEVYTSGDVSSISENQKEVEIVIDYSLKTSTEYILDIEGTTKSGREVHYYTRLKYYLENSHLSDKLNFIRKFHKNTFVKSKAQALEPYLETEGVNKNNTLSKVDIKSGSDFVTWGNLSPSLVSDEWMTVTEYNMETACVKYNYFVKAKTNSGEEIFQIKEFYRVRYAGGRNYLLNFERNMEAQFDVKNAAVKSNQLKIGITEEHENKILVNNKGNIVYFVRQGALYSYNLKENKVTCIYSMQDPEASYQHKIYNEHDIRILKLDDDGSIYFCAFGYFARGEYEGDVAVVLYKYKTDGELDELVYMPAETTYQRLKEDFEKYGYVSSRGVYYFTVADRVYSYNITGRRLEVLANSVHKNSFMTLENANCYAWSSNYNTGYGESVTIYNLETDEKQILYRPDEKTYIRLLGVIDDNVVYGYVNKNDIGRNNQGIKIVPCYAMYIADTSGNVKKEFKKTGEYIQSIHSNGNVINISLCKKDGSGKFVAGDTDSISNLGSGETTKIRYSSRVTNKCLTEWYIQFPSSFEMPDIPKYASGPSNVMTTERFVRLEESDVNRYYVSALGRIVSSYSSVRTAIKEADKVMGVVITNKHRILWERGGSFLQNSVAGIEGVAEDSKVSNYAACAYMLLKNAACTPESKTVFANEDSIYDMLNKYLETPVSLSGCSLEQVLYFVSNNKPVIANVSENRAVLIGGYTAKTLTIYDPATGKARDVNRKKYEKIFKAAGNNFISYMK